MQKQKTKAQSQTTTKSKSPVTAQKSTKRGDAAATKAPVKLAANKPTANKPTADTATKTTGRANVTAPVKVAAKAPAKVAAKAPAKAPAKTATKAPKATVSAAAKTAPKVTANTAAKAPTKVAKAPTKVSSKTAAKAPAKVPAPTKTPAPAKVAAKAPAKVAAKAPAKRATKAPAKAPAKTAGKVAAQATAKPKRVMRPRVKGGSQTLPTSGYRGVSRVDSYRRNSHGWYVRVRFKGEVHSKFFTDSVHGGSDRALKKAVAYRNRLERELGKPRTDRTLIITPSRNNTGIVGVKRILKEGAPVFEVTWCPQPNVLQRTSVSIRKYGEEEALRRAAAIRLKRERELYGALIQDV